MAGGHQSGCICGSCVKGPKGFLAMAKHGKNCKGKGCKGC